MQFFASNGFPCPALRNPSDHFLRTINKDFDAVSIYNFLITIITLKYNHHGRQKEIVVNSCEPLVINTRTSYKSLVAQQALRKSLIFSSSHTCHLGLSMKYNSWYLIYVNR